MSHVESFLAKLYINMFALCSLSFFKYKTHMHSFFFCFFLLFTNRVEQIIHKFWFDSLSVLIRTEKSGYPLLYEANQILKCNIHRKRSKSQISIFIGTDIPFDPLYTYIYIHIFKELYISFILYFYINFTILFVFK